MFQPNFTVRTYDRNIFGGKGEGKTLRPKELASVEVLFYYQGNIAVGTITGELDVDTFEGYSRGHYLPVRIKHLDEIYCGWVSLKEIELTD